MILKRLLGLATTLFPLWIILGCIWAWNQPAAWTWFRPHIEIGLGVIMLGMGLTLRFTDFAAVARDPKNVALGVAAQFVIMPAAGWLIARLFQLETGLTMCSTVVAIFATPLLTRWLAGAWLPVDAAALFKSMLIVVLLPLVCGITVNTLLGKMKRPGSIRAWIDAIGPLLSALVVVLIVGCIVASKREEIARAALPLFISVLLLHAIGFGVGYLFALVGGCRESLRRTISIEVGMQNSGLGAALASRHFAHLALAPVPAAISAVYHCLIGSLLAAWWRSRPPESGE